MLKVTQLVCAISSPSAGIGGVPTCTQIPRPLGRLLLKGFPTDPPNTSYLGSRYHHRREDQPVLLWSFSSPPYSTQAILSEVKHLDGGGEAPLPRTPTGAGYLGEASDGLKGCKPRSRRVVEKALGVCSGGYDGSECLRLIFEEEFWSFGSIGHL